MSSLLSIGLANALAALLLAIPAFLVGRYARRPALAHALWLLVLLKLVTPPLFRVGLPWLPAERESEERVVMPRLDPVPPVVRSDELLLFPQNVQGQPLALDAQLDLTLADTRRASVRPVPARVDVVPQPNFVTDPPPSPMPPASAERKADTGDLFSLLLIVWAVGGVIVLGRAGFLVWRFSRLLAEAKPARADIQQQSDDLARQMGMTSGPRVFMVPGSLPPMVWAVGRARVLFPVGLLDRLDDEARASLLAHELAHIRRRDHWVRWLELLAVAVYWWYPLVWLARRQLQEREEECCDAWAAEQVAPRVYAGAILDAVDFLSEARPRVPSIASPLAGKQSLRERLTLIMTGETTKRMGWIGRFVLLGLALTALPLLPSLTHRIESAAPKKSDEVKPVLTARLEVEGEPTVFSNAVDLVQRSDEIMSVAISPDGKRIAAGSGLYDRPGRLQMWDFASRKLLRTIDSHQGVASVTFSPKSDRFAWAGWGGQAKIAQVEPFREMLVVPLTGNNRFTYSKNGKWLLAAGENRIATLFDTNTNRPIDRLNSGESLALYCAAFSNDSKFAVVGGGSFNDNRGGGPNLAFVFDSVSRKRVAKLEGHTLAVINAAFSPDDTLLATASADSTVRLWNPQGFTLVRTLTGHTGSVKGLAFSPDGKKLITGSWDKTIRVWDTKDGKELAKLEGHPAAVREIALTADGKHLVSGGAWGAVKIWDMVALKEVATLRQNKDVLPPAPSALTMAVSRDGKRIATGGEDGKVTLRNSLSGEVLRTLTAHDDAVTALAFSRDGKRLASSGPDSIVKVWDVESGKELLALKGHSNWVYSLTFSGDGKTLASGSYDRGIRLWDVATGKQLAELTGHKASVRRLTFSPDDRILASGGDNSVKLWSVSERKLLDTLKGHSAIVRGVEFTRDGKTLFSADEDGHLKRWDVETRKETGSVKWKQGELYCMALSPGGRSVVLAGQSGEMCFYDTSSLVLRNRRFGHNQGVLGLGFAPDSRRLFTLGGGDQLFAWTGQPGFIRAFDGHTGPVRVVTYSPDGKYLLSCGGWPQGDRTLRLWDVATGKQVRVLMTAKAHLQSATFTADGKHALTGCDDGVITMFEVATGKEVRRLTGHGEGTVAQLSVSPDGKQLLSAGHDKTVRLWDIASGKQLQVFIGHTDWARCAAFLPDGKRIVSGGRDMAARVWDIDSGKLLKTIDHKPKATEENKMWVETLAVLPDGKRCLTGGGNALHLIDLEQGKLVRAYPGHHYGVTSVALAKGGRTAISTSFDGTVRLWDVEAGSEMRQVTGHRDFVWCAAIAPDGKTFVTSGGGARNGSDWTAGDDFGIRMWKMPAVK